MSKRRKVQFPRLSVYAVSAGELARCLQAVEWLRAAVQDLAHLVGDLQAEVHRLQAVPTPRRRRSAAGDVAGDLAAINAALADGGGG